MDAIRLSNARLIDYIISVIPLMCTFTAAFRRGSVRRLCPGYDGGGSESGVESPTGGSLFPNRSVPILPTWGVHHISIATSTGQCILSYLISSFMTQSTAKVIWIWV